MGLRFVVQTLASPPAFSVCSCPIYGRKWHTSMIPPGFLYLKAHSSKLWLVIFFFDQCPPIFIGLITRGKLSLMHREKRKNSYKISILIFTSFLNYSLRKYKMDNIPWCCWISPVEKRHSFLTLKKVCLLVTRDFLCPIPGSSRHSWLQSFLRAAEQIPRALALWAQCGSLWFSAKWLMMALFSMPALSRA